MSLDDKIYQERCRETIQRLQNTNNKLYDMAGIPEKILKGSEVVEIINSPEEMEKMILDQENDTKVKMATIQMENEMSFKEYQEKQKEASYKAYFAPSITCGKSRRTAKKDSIGSLDTKEKENAQKAKAKTNIDWSNYGYKTYSAPGPILSIPSSKTSKYQLGIDPYGNPIMDKVILNPNEELIINIEELADELATQELTIPSNTLKYGESLEKYKKIILKHERRKKEQ